MVLEDEGYLVDLATDGLQALERVRSCPPDVILLDVMMPNMSGTQVLKELQDDPKTARIPVLVMTAVNGVAGGKVVRSPCEVVEKPFDVHDLLNKIALVMYRNSSDDSSESGASSSSPLA